VVLLCSGIGITTWCYFKFARPIDATLRAGFLGHTSILYASPQWVTTGQEASIDEIAAHLRRSGYSESKDSRLGWYRNLTDSIEIHPGPDAYSQEETVITLRADESAKFVPCATAPSEPSTHSNPPITNVFDRSREKQWIVRFNEIPPVMVNAVLAAEDKHFFHHPGFDPLRILRAMWVDIRERRNSQGASTLTQQLARTVWLGPQRGWGRKIPELFMTLRLEASLSKRQIFEDYANTIYLGNVGSFSIHGFGKASQLYFGKDLSQVTLAEAAFLAGLIQAPATRNPFRYPERAKARRDMILQAMRTDRFISEKQYGDATRSPLSVVGDAAETSDAPYVVDLVNETLHNHFQEYDSQNHAFRVFTTLDMKFSAMQ
jgi:penicillin-binding protein 1B